MFAHTEGPQPRQTLWKIVDAASPFLRLNKSIGSGAPLAQHTAPRLAGPAKTRLHRSTLCPLPSPPPPPTPSARSARPSPARASEKRAHPSSRDASSVTRAAVGADEGAAIKPFEVRTRRRIIRALLKRRHAAPPPAPIVSASNGDAFVPGRLSSSEASHPNCAFRARKNISARNSTGGSCLSGFSDPRTRTSRRSATSFPCE